MIDPYDYIQTYQKDSDFNDALREARRVVGYGKRAADRLTVSKRSAKRGTSSKRKKSNAAGNPPKGTVAGQSIGDLGTTDIQTIGTEDAT